MLVVLGRRESVVTDAPVAPDQVGTSCVSARVTVVVAFVDVCEGGQNGSTRVTTSFKNQAHTHTHMLTQAFSVQRREVYASLVNVAFLAVAVKAAIGVDAPCVSPTYAAVLCTLVLVCSFSWGGNIKNDGMHFQTIVDKRTITDSG